MTQLLLRTPPPRHPLLRIETKTEAESRLSLWSVLAGVAGVAAGLLILGAIFAAACVWGG